MQKARNGHSPSPVKYFEAEVYKLIFQQLIQQYHSFLTLIGRTSWPLASVGPFSNGPGSARRDRYRSQRGDPRAMIFRVAQHGVA